MEGQGQNSRAINRSHATLPIQQDYLFVDASDAKTSRQGRRNARSFVMQKARRERPWSTSKQIAKQRTKDSASPRSTGTPVSISTPNTASSSPTTESRTDDHFLVFEQTDPDVFERSNCSSRKTCVMQPGQALCSKCILLKATGSIRGPDNGTFDPFEASAVRMDKGIYELLNHCKIAFFTLEEKFFPVTRLV